MPKFTLIISLAMFGALLPASGRGAVTTPAGVDTNPLNLDPLVRQAYQHFYILDYDGALSRFEKVQAQNPAIRSPWITCSTRSFSANSIVSICSTPLSMPMTGFFSGKHAVAADPAVAERVNSLYTKAIELSEQQLSKNPEDVDALYARGWARSLRAVYIGLVATELRFRPPCRFAGP